MKRSTIQGFRKHPAMVGMLTRGMLAENKFLEYAMARAGLSEAGARRALKMYKKEKLIKIDHVTGQFTFKHGAFGDPEVLRRAAK